MLILYACSSFLYDKQQWFIGKYFFHSHLLYYTISSHYYLCTLRCPWLENLGLAWNEQIRVFNVKNLVTRWFVHFKLGQNFPIRGNTGLLVNLSFSFLQFDRYFIPSKVDWDTQRIPIWCLPQLRCIPWTVRGCIQTQLATRNIPTHPIKETARQLVFFHYFLHQKMRWRA